MTRMSVAAETVKPPLDDVMLSMDVVDTLRHEEYAALRELDDETRRAQLLDRLRQIYRSQGIEVPDHILEEGVRALEERRFVYEPPASSFQVRLAHLYVSRMRWGKWLAGGVSALVLIWMGWQAVYVWPRAQQAERARIVMTQTLPESLSTLYATIDAETESASVLVKAAQLRDAGLAAAKAGQVKAAREAEKSLSVLLDELRLDYEVTIVSRPGELSGLWRIPRVNPNSRNYYLVVEALDMSGKAVEREIVNEETSLREAVKKWAVRVSKPVFDAVQADKLDDGIIQNAVIGVKRRGQIDVDWRVDIRGGALTQW